MIERSAEQGKPTVDCDEQASFRGTSLRRATKSQCVAIDATQSNRAYDGWAASHSEDDGTDRITVRVCNGVQRQPSQVKSSQVGFSDAFKPKANGRCTSGQQKCTCASHALGVAADASVDSEHVGHAIACGAAREA